LALLAHPVQAADRIYVSYNLLERSIPVSSLETYARDGTIDADLAVYAQFAGAEALQQLRRGLTARVELDVVAISQFLYSPQGESLLERVGQVIQPESREPGQKAIRAALILAAADPEGLTPLNVLRKFPTRGIRIDVRRSLEIAEALQTAVSLTNQATQLIVQAAASEVATEPTIAFEQLPDLRRQGGFNWQTRTFENVIDLDRPAFRVRDRGLITSRFGVLPGRQFPVDLYLPDRRSANSPSAPVIVISHGLGSDRKTFAYLARHLASHGFAVLVPEHPGSNSKQLEALIAGTASEIAEPEEFVDRPLDITYLLDYMEQRVKVDSSLRGRLNLTQVGVIGQSFGGYTALALAGAAINPLQLRSGCLNLANQLNISLVLQCRALQLTSPTLNLTDRRVKAVMALNPFGSAVFGQDSIGQIQIPLMLLSSSADTISPALPEQIQPFTWAATANKHLALVDGGTHFSVIAGSDGGGVTLPAGVIGPNPAIARRYVNALSVAFFQTHLANQPFYRQYLSASYAQAISETSLKLSLVRSLTSEQVTQALKQDFPVLPTVPPPGSTAPAPATQP
jgi:predicted dienelactone hydrolase